MIFIFFKFVQLNRFDVAYNVKRVELCLAADLHFGDNLL